MCKLSHAVTTLYSVLLDFVLYLAFQFWEYSVTSDFWFMYDETRIKRIHLNPSIYNDFFKQWKCYVNHACIYPYLYFVQLVMSRPIADYIQVKAVQWPIAHLYSIGYLYNPPSHLNNVGKDFQTIKSLILWITIVWDPRY